MVEQEIFEFSLHLLNTSQLTSGFPNKLETSGHLGLFQQFTLVKILFILVPFPKTLQFLYQKHQTLYLQL